MIADAIEAGLSQPEFWALSLPELRVQFRGAKQRMDALYELGIFIAWHTALFTRAKKLPELGPLMQKVRGRTEEAKPQPWQEVRSLMAAHREALADPKTAKKKRPIRVPIVRTHGR